MPKQGQADLNRMNRAAANVKLGDTVEELIDTVNALVAALKGIAAKLDADAGVADTNYASSLTAALAAIKELADR